jgi:pimeloyl-ACP methyl ester carboxylesterase
MTTTGYAPDDELDIYYEVHGSGQPLVLLHGAMSTIGTSFGKVLPSFARSRQVVAIEQQSHGHTADIDRPLTYEQMADDTAAVLRHLDIARADVFGYSMGGGVALQVAVRHPDLVRKLVLASAAYEPEGFHPGALDNAADVKPEDLAGTPFQEDYVRTAPNPGHWARLVAKCGQLDSGFKGWPEDVVQSIEAPTLVIIGDSDIVRPARSALVSTLRRRCVRRHRGYAPFAARGTSRHHAHRVGRARRVADLDDRSVSRRADSRRRRDRHVGTEPPDTRRYPWERSS